MFRKLLAVSLLFLLTACDRGISPTEPDPPESRSPVTIELTSHEPAHGSRLGLGGRIWLFGTYTRNTDEPVYMAFALVRDDGASYIDTMLGPLSQKTGSWQFNFAFESDTDWGGAHGFSRGHNVTVFFIAGDGDMIRWFRNDYSVNWSHVKHKQSLGLTYTVPF